MLQGAPQDQSGRAPVNVVQASDVGDIRSVRSLFFDSTPGVFPFCTTLLLGQVLNRIPCSLWHANAYLVVFGADRFVHLVSSHARCRSSPWIRWEQRSAGRAPRNRELVHEFNAHYAFHHSPRRFGRGFKAFLAAFRVEWLHNGRHHAQRIRGEQAGALPMVPPGVRRVQGEKTNTFREGERVMSAGQVKESLPVSSLASVEVFLSSRRPLLPAKRFFPVVWDGISMVL